jgi:glycosyltransferase involved in cell wall biosynthesis
MQDERQGGSGGINHFLFERLKLKIPVKPIRIVHLITDFRPAGAQMMLYKLLSRTDREIFQPEALSLTGPGPVGERIKDLGIPTSHVGMKHGVPNPLAIARLARILRKNPPDLLQTWMYHADLAGGMAARLSRRRFPVVWGIRNSTLDPQGSKKGTLWTARMCGRLARWLPDKIVSCSAVAAEVHLDWGYDAERMTVIPNGFDLELFRPEPAVRQSIRGELEIDPSVPVIGTAARFDPQKDFRTLISAAGLLLNRNPDVQFVFCGRGVSKDNTQLREWIAKTPSPGNFHLAGAREDMPSFMNALDIYTSSSAFGEAFPNTVGEAMACGAPCVVTDVGDSAKIVGDTGRVVPPRNPQALAGAWTELLSLTPEALKHLGEKARDRIEDNYEIHTITKRFEEFYKTLISEKTSKP